MVNGFLRALLANMKGLQKITMIEYDKAYLWYSFIQKEGVPETGIKELHLKKSYKFLCMMTAQKDDMTPAELEEWSKVRLVRYFQHLEHISMEGTSAKLYYMNFQFFKKLKSISIRDQNPDYMFDLDMVNTMETINDPRCFTLTLTLPGSQQSLLEMLSHFSDMKLANIQLNFSQLLLPSHLIPLNNQTIIQVENRFDQNVDFTVVEKKLLIGKNEES